VILTKFAVATVLTIIFAAVPELIAALISGGGYTEPIVKVSQNGPPIFTPGTPISTSNFALGLFVGAVVGAVIYNAIFVMISAATTRAIAVGLLYVLIWEAVLANFVSGARLLSVSHYALGIANGIAHDATLNAGLTVAVSVVMGAIVTVAALALAINLLSGFTLKGEPA
jgi:ABC-2 type transport system permease protein